MQKLSCDSPKEADPNEPAKVKPITPRQLKDRLDAADGIRVYDVRTDQERAIATIEGARLLDRAAQDEIMKLPKSTPLAFLCHHGTRSQQAAEFFLSHGFSDVSNVVGGIDRWSEEVDPNVPRY